MPEEVNCNLCGANRTRLLFRLRDYRLQVDELEWNAVRCRSCGLGYLNPRPTVDEIKRYYPSAYFRHRGLQTERYRRLAEYVPGERGKLLDVGTARGDFIAEMRERGWQVAGIESAQNAGNPHGLQIYRGQFPEQCDLPSNSYDVVTAWAVFEHLHDPLEAFRVCARLLRPDGHLIVQVPNLRSIWARWALQEDVPRHLYFFNPKTLRKFADRAGLRVERVVHTTDLFGGSGRGVLRLALIRAVGGSTADFFDLWRTPRRERFRRRPLLTLAWTGVAALERAILTDWAVRSARISGQIVVGFRKPMSDDTA
jgi:2-polyprenyl-3-methyl-5-hydroxy-6-metoxy-1,4-benzoquinol methylase